jgi:hypothetical protein
MIRITSQSSSQSTTVSTMSGRRATLKGLIALTVIPAFNLGFGVRESLALIPANDDDDEAFLAKAKENRSNRIASEVSKERQYVNDTGLKLDENTAKVQFAVYKMSKAGSGISRGDLGDAAATLAGDWTQEVSAGAKELGANASEFVQSVDALSAKCAAGDQDAAKASYLVAAKALRALARAAGVEDKLRLL